MTISKRNDNLVKVFRKEIVKGEIPISNLESYEVGSKSYKKEVNFAMETLVSDPFTREVIVRKMPQSA